MSGPIVHQLCEQRNKIFSHLNVALLVYYFSDGFKTHSSPFGANISRNHHLANKLSMSVLAVIFNWLFFSRLRSTIIKSGLNQYRE